LAADQLPVRLEGHTWKENRDVQYPDIDTRGAAKNRAKPGQRGLGATLVLGLGAFAVGTDALVVAGFLPDTAASLHVSTATAGQSVTSASPRPCCTRS
jgi:hypothetical protein